MQTRKNFLGGGSTREHASPRVCKPQKKVSESLQLADKKVTGLIASARKQRFAGILPKRSKEPTIAKNTNIPYLLQRDETSDICFVRDTVKVDSFDHKGCNEGTAKSVLNTLFSPTLHISKDVGRGIVRGGKEFVDFTKLFNSEDHEMHLNHGIKESPQVDVLKCHANLETFSVCKEEKKPHENTRMDVDKICHVEMEVDSSLSSENSDMQKSSDHMPLSEANSVDSHCKVDLVGAKLSPEVSAIYFAMQQSKLECVDEPSEDSMSAEVCVDADDCEDFDDFDPYVFMKSLPALSSVVPTFRPMLLPKQTRSCPSSTLVLDLDETLVHSTLEHCNDADFTFPVNFNLKEHTVYVRCRPHLKDFMERVASLFEIIIFTASQSIYAERLLNVLDPKRRIFRHRVYRESCVFVDGNYLKDLSVLGRDLARVIIIDNSPQAFGFQVDNGIPIESWFGDRMDQELLLLLPFLESLVGVEDVRPMIANKFNLRNKIEAAGHSPLNSNAGSFER